jgi:hypothetical protein
MAARYWVGGGSSANWNATAPTNWGASSGGANNQSVPNQNDTVTFDGAGVNGNTDATISAIITVNTLTITTGYTATMTHNAVLTILTSWNYQSAYTIAGSSAITINGACTTTSNGGSWPNSLNILGGNQTITGVLTILGSLSFTGSTQNHIINGSTIITNGLSLLNNQVSGTSSFIITGGILTGSNASGRGIFVNLTVRPDNSNVTISGTFGFGIATLAYTPSAYSVTSTGTIVIEGNTACTFDTGAMRLNNVTLASSSNFTYSLNSNLLLDGILIIRALNTLFSGSYGFEVATLIHTQVVTATVTLQEGVTYEITNLLSAFSSRIGSVVLFTSSSGSNRANLILRNGAECRCLCNFTRIDASGGRPIRSFNGVITDCINIVPITDLQTVGTGI